MGRRVHRASAIDSHFEAVFTSAIEVGIAIAGFSGIAIALDWIFVTTLILDLLLAFLMFVRVIQKLRRQRSS